VLWRSSRESQTRPEATRNGPRDELCDEFRCHRDAQREGQECDARADWTVAIGILQELGEKEEHGEDGRAVHSITVYVAARLRLARSRSGMRGFLVRVSTKMKRPNSSAPLARHATVIGSAQPSLGARTKP
jgi:hypothetical protein